MQCAKKALSDSLGLVDFAIGLANSVLNLQLLRHHVLEKSFKIETLWDILEKITFVKKSVFCAKERLKAQQYANFIGDHESVFAYDFKVPVIVHFPLFEVP